MAELTCHSENRDMTSSWYAIYTKSKSEIKLQNCISDFSLSNNLNYETYLPLKHEIKTRNHKVSVRKVPLFTNYLFVKHDDNAFQHIIKMKGVCHYVRFGPHPSKIPVEQIEMIKVIVNCYPDTVITSNSSVKGTKVKINNGPLAGYQAILLDGDVSNNLALEVKGLQLYFNVKVPALDTL